MIPYVEPRDEIPGIRNPIFGQNIKPGQRQVYSVYPSLHPY